jgi:hypothetical protein
MARYGSVNLRVARAALYRLSSIGLYYLVTAESLAPTSFGTVPYSRILRKARSAARRDFTPRYRDSIFGGPPYPSAAEVFDLLERKPFQYMSRSTIEALTRDQVAVIMADHLRQVLAVRNSVFFWSKFSFSPGGKTFFDLKHYVLGGKERNGEAEPNVPQI